MSNPLTELLNLAGAQSEPVLYEPQTADEIGALMALFHKIRREVGDKLSVELHGRDDRLAVNVEFTSLGGPSLRTLIDLADEAGCIYHIATGLRTIDGFSIGPHATLSIGYVAREVKKPADEPHIVH